MITCRHTRHRFSSWLAGVLALSLLIPVTGSAHDGPPFPVVMDQNVGACLISVWADPDVGTGSFFVIVNAPPGKSIPDDLRIQIGVQPTSGRLAEAFCAAERENLRGQVQYKALVRFDAQELWRVRVRVQSAAGSGEALATVEATPPGFGHWDLLVYLLPFVAVGLLWFVAVMRKRAPKRP